MASVEEILIELRADADGLKSELNDVRSSIEGGEDAAKDFNKEMQEGSAKSEKSVSSLGKVFRSFLGAAAIAAATRGIIKYGKESLKAYDAQQKAVAKLNQALKGNDAMTSRLARQASELQGVTLFGDEQSLEAQARLASILGQDEEAIRKLLPLVQDLATAKNMDLAMAAELVAKSVGSSTNALSRYGIQIEGAVGSSERLESAVAALNQQVGGQAVRAAQEGLGVYTQYSNIMGDIQENIGGMLARGLVPMVEKMKEAATTVQRLTTDYHTNSRALEEQRDDLNDLVWRITQTNEGEEARLKLIGDLNQRYPDFLQNLNAETVSNEQLVSRLQTVNEGYVQRIAVMELVEQRQEELDKLKEKEGKVANTIVRANIAQRDAYNLLRDEMFAGSEAADEFMTKYSHLYQIIEDQESLDSAKEFMRAINEEISPGMLTGTDGLGQETINALIEARAEFSRATTGLFGIDRFARFRRQADDARETVDELTERIEYLMDLWDLDLSTDFEDAPTPTPSTITPTVEIDPEFVLPADFESDTGAAAQAAEEMMAAIEKEWEERGLYLPFPDMPVAGFRTPKPPSQNDDPKPEMKPVISDEEVEEAESRAGEIQNIIGSMSQVVSATFAAATNAISAQLQSLTDQITRQQQRVAELRAVADGGNAEQLAIEEQRLQELTQAREQAQQRQIELQRRQARINSIISLSNAVAGIFKTIQESGPGSLAIIPAIVTAAAAAIGTLTSLMPQESFYEGTERTGRGNLDGRGGFAAVLHPNERVMPERLNRQIGYKVSNEELVRGYRAYQGLTNLPRVSSSSFSDANIVDRLASIEQLLANQKAPSVMITSKGVHSRWSRVERKEKKNDKRWRK